MYSNIKWINEDDLETDSFGVVTFMYLLLYLDSCALTDQGIIYIKLMKSLKVLDLKYNEVNSSTILSCLKNLKSLKRMILGKLIV